MEELFHKLGIDWQLIIAQMVNFAILFFVLNRFVWKPIINILERRRKQIEEVNHADDTYKTKLAEIEKNKESELNSAREKGSRIIKDAESSAERLKIELLADAGREAETIRTDGRAGAETERSALLRDAKNELGSIVASAVEKVIGEVVDKKTEESLTSKAILLAEKELS